MRKVFSIFCILVVFITVLPIDQEGKLLSTSELNEEVGQMASEAPEENAKAQKFFSGNIQKMGIYYLEQAVEKKDIPQQLLEKIPMHPHSDILMPPPKAEIS